MNATGEQSQNNKTSVRLLGIGAAFAFLTLVFNTSPLLMSALINGLNLSEAEAGAILTGEGLLLGMAAIATALLVPAFNPRKSILWGALALLLLNGLTTFVADTVGVITIRILAGIAAGICLAGVNLLIAKSEEPVRNYGLVVTASTIVGLAALLALPYAIEPYQYAGGYAGLALFGLLLMPAIWLSGRLKPGIHDGHSLPAQPSAPGRNVTIVFLATLALVQISQAAYFSLFSEFAVSKGWRLEQIGQLLAITYVASLIGSLLASLLGERWGRFGPLVAGLALHSLAVSLVLLFARDNLMMSGAILQTLGYFFALAFQLGLGARLDPSGKLSEWAIGVFFISLGLGPYVGGLLVEFLGFEAIAYMVASVFAVALFTFKWLDRLVEEPPSQQEDDLGSSAAHIRGG